MKLKGVDFMATAAIAMGTGQLMIHGIDVYNSKDLSSYSFPSVLIGVSASLLWTLYQFNKEGMNYSVVYSGFGLVIQIYILQKLLFSRRGQQRTSTEKNEN